MFIQCKLIILLLTLTLNGQVDSGKIIGGHEVLPHSRPYMVLFQKHMQNGDTNYCDGFLVNEDFVMSAAHCQARSYTVFLGVHNFSNSNGMQSVNVEQAFVHEDYNPADYSNDIMLLKLRSKAKFSKNVKPIALAGQSVGGVPKSCIVSGWGSTGNGYMSLVLMEANVSLSDNKLCATANKLCSEGKNGPSQGDSGGPLVCGNTTAYGVVSSGMTPHSGGPQINFYTKISDFRDWINLTIKNAR